jgi:hypothetical protein
LGRDPVESHANAERGSMRKFIGLASAVAATLAAVAPSVADSQQSECFAGMDRLAKVEATTRKAADFYKLMIENFQAALRDYGGPEKVEAEENKYFARFDVEKTMTLSGSVKEFQWANPHAHIVLTVRTDESPADQQWAIEMNGAARLALLGWRPKTLTSGMLITATIHPLRDGTNGGQFITATLPDGRQLGGGPPATLQTRLQTLREQAAAADRAVEELK